MAQQPAKMPIILNSEPSQQDLELARHLQSFQSQGVAQKERPEPEVAQQHVSRSSPGISHGGEPRNDAEGTARSPSQPQQPSDPPVIKFTPVQQQQPQPQQQPKPSASAGGSGQRCSNCGTNQTPLWRRSPTGAVICNACGLYYKARNQMRPVGVKRGAAAMSHLQEGQAQDRENSPNIIQRGATYVPADRSVNGTCPGGGRCNGTGGREGCNGCLAYNNRVARTAQVALRQANHGTGEPARISPSDQGPVQASQSVTIACQNCGTTITPLWRRDEAGNTICNACGLYYKLHNQHRPVNMKKAEIKRRRRAVPSTLPSDENSSAYISDITEEEQRLSLPLPTETSTPSRPQAPRSISDAERPSSGPIPVDFTDMFRAKRPPSETDSQSSVPRKRSFSSTTPDPPPPDPQAQPVASRSENVNPSLPIRREPGSEQLKVEGRRAGLQAEAERMRKLLIEKEREIAALADEG